MDSLSVSTNFEFPDDYAAGESSGNFSVRKKPEGRKELRKILKLSQKQNLELKKQITQQNSELTELKQSLKSLNEVIAVTGKNAKNESEVSNAASSKIVDLCRRNRQLKAELEITKSKYSKIDAKLAKLERDINTEGDLNKISNIKSKKTSSCHVVTSVENLQDQLSSTKQKLFDSLNINSELKNNLKLAQKCLQQEIGENISLNTLTSSNSNWRGRAQQILSLQNKITELKERLDLYQSTTNSPFEDPSRAPIRKIEVGRKAELDELQNQVRQMQNIIDQQNTKISALKARNKNLVDDAMNYKLKTLNLMEQSDVNDNSIAAINEKLNIQKYHFDHQVKQLQNQITETEETRKEIEVVLQRTRMEVDQAYTTVKKKELEIESLSIVIRRQEDEIRSICGDFLFSCRDLKKSEFLAILDSLESEKNGITKLNEELNSRNKKYEEKIRTQLEQISKQKIRVSRLEAKIKTHNKETETHLERKKRNQRITSYSNNLSSRLSVSGMVFENSLMSLDTTTGNNAQTNDLEYDDLKNKIEFLNDKVEFLEDKMKILTKQKDDDLEFFNNVMRDSKNVLLNMIKQRSTDECLELQYDIENTNFNNLRDQSINNIALQKNNDVNEKFEEDKNDIDNNSLENYHINMNYRDSDSVSNAIIKSTAKFPSTKSSIVSLNI